MSGVLYISVISFRLQSLRGAVAATAAVNVVPSLRIEGEVPETGVAPSGALLWTLLDCECATLR